MKTSLLAGLLVCVCGMGQAAEPTRAVPFDVLVVAPHSDDEAIGCTGVMLRALAVKQRVGVVIITAGDGFPQAAAAAAKKPVNELNADDFVQLAALRQRHSLQAMTRLGVQKDDLLFLGYPDGGLAKLYESTTNQTYRQPFTGRTETYGPIVADDHSRTHGQPAAYLRASVVGDLKEILQVRQPREIYVTGETDSHADHRAAFYFVRDAMQAAGSRATLWTYIVHGQPPAQPPDRVVQLTEQELATKRALLESYQVGVSPVHDRLAETYTLPEERFWKVVP